MSLIQVLGNSYESDSEFDVRLVGAGAPGDWLVTPDASEINCSNLLGPHGRRTHVLPLGLYEKQLVNTSFAREIFAAGSRLFGKLFGYFTFVVVS